MCYFALTNADARCLGGSQMAGASFLISVPMRQHKSVDGAVRGEASRPWHSAPSAASTLRALRRQTGPLSCQRSNSAQPAFNAWNIKTVVKMHTIKTTHPFK